MGKKDKEDKLMKVQKEFSQAKSKYDLSLMDERELLYLGTREVDQNINRQNKNRKKANNVVNICYEFTETQVDTTIPQPSVKSKRLGYEGLAEVIEDSTKNDLLESDIYRINDENERTTPIQGFSIITVDWDPDFKHHLYRGEIILDNRHPKTLIPQPGVYDLQKMNYFFIMSSESKVYAKKRYGVDLTDESEQYPEANTIDYGSDNPETNSSNTAGGNKDNDKITIITKWYRDENGDIGKYTWCNDTELENIPKFYYRRLKRCNECGKVKGMKDTCECGSEKFKENLEEFETLESDIIRADGLIIPAMSPQTDDAGNAELEIGLDEYGNEIQQPIMTPTKIKYFCPTRYPVIIRKNVPIAFNFGGQSDIDIVRDQQDALKKVITTIEEKILTGTAIIKALKGHQFDLKNELYKVVRGEANELQQMGLLNLQADIEQDIIFAQQQYRYAQSMLGITDSFQGKPDPTAQSGVAKQIQINQASGRMMSKAFNKRRAFKELFEIMFEFKLAFYDEVRPYMKEGTNNQPVYGEFSKYDFLEQDAAGEWYYNTDFIFDADAGTGIPKDKMWLLEQAKEDYRNKAIDKVQYWTLKEKLGYPGAGEIKAQAEEEAELMKQQQQMMMQQQMQQL